MKARHKRLGFLLLGLVGLAAITGLVLNAMQGNLSYFFSPTEVAEGKAPSDHIFRLGGLVEMGSVQRASGDLKVNFVVSDGAEKINVSYTGILPDLFKEGQGVIAQGKLGGDGVFLAQEVLAKHDENYMPPEVKDALDKGHARGNAELAAKQAPAPSQN
jgi:cytochrome c-type biogenesis protein CcmE